MGTEGIRTVFTFYSNTDGIPTLDSQLANIPTPSSILLQPDDLAHLVPPKEPKVIFVGAREPDTLTFHRYHIRHK